MHNQEFVFKNDLLFFIPFSSYRDTVTSKGWH